MWWGCWVMRLIVLGKGGKGQGGGVDKELTFVCL